MKFRYDTQHPHLASYMILRKGKKIAFLYRSNTSWMNKFWALPAGKVESGEPFSRAAVRETEEEIGIKISLKNIRHNLTVHRFSDGDAPEWVDVYFEVTKWKGEPFNAEPHKHSRMEWIEADNLPDNVIPDEVAALNAIHDGKSYLEYGWGEDKARFRV